MLACVVAVLAFVGAGLWLGLRKSAGMGDRLGLAGPEVAATPVPTVEPYWRSTRHGSAA